MENRSHALLAGAFLVVLIACLGAVLFWFAGERTAVNRYEIVSPIAVSGLIIDAPVRLRGVDVGAVKAIRFDERDPRNIIVTVTVDQTAPMTEGVYGQLALWGISGLRYVALDDDGTNRTPLPPGGRIEMRESFIGQAETSVEALLASANAALQRFEALLSDENIARTTRTLEKIERGVDDVRDSLAGVESDVTRDTLPKVHTLIDLLVTDARKLEQLLTSLNEQPQSLILGRTPPRPGPGEPGYKERKRAR